MNSLYNITLTFWRQIKLVFKKFFSSENTSEFGRFFILIALITILILPVYLMVYLIQFGDLTSAATWRTELIYYYGRTESHNEIWGILAPLLVAISVGANFSNAISTRTVLLFLFFLLSYVVADIGAVTLEAKTDLQAVLTARNNVDVQNVQLYFTSVGTMCTSAIATVLGLTASKLGK